MTPSLADIVNVASVPQRSPFRFPGGKTWFVPRLRQWLAPRQRPAVLVEPFAGGGIISLTAAAEGFVDHVVMVELDDEVAAVWQTILDGDAAALGQRIVEFDLTLTSVLAILESEPASVSDRAFRTIVKNRVNRGGIMAPGAGLIKEGEAGKGLRSRWYPETLQKRILAIQEYRERITFIQGDGIEVMRRYADNADAVFFIDPPYSAPGKSAGSRLYKQSRLDHEALFDIAASTRGDFLMTYDNAESVRAMAAARGFDTELVAMKSGHHAKMSELLVSRSLTWARP